MQISSMIRGGNLQPIIISFEWSFTSMKHYNSLYSHFIHSVLYVPEVHQRQKDFHWFLSLCHCGGSMFEMDTFNPFEYKVNTGLHGKYCFSVITGFWQQVRWFFSDEHIAAWCTRMRRRRCKGDSSVSWEVLANNIFRFHKRKASHDED